MRTQVRTQGSNVALITAIRAPFNWQKKKKTISFKITCKTPGSKLYHDSERSVQLNIYGRQ